MKPEDFEKFGPHQLGKLEGQVRSHISGADEFHTKMEAVYQHSERIQDADFIDHIHRVTDKMYDTFVTSHAKELEHFDEENNVVRKEHFDQVLRELDKDKLVKSHNKAMEEVLRSVGFTDEMLSHAKSKESLEAQARELALYMDEEFGLNLDQSGNNFQSLVNTIYADAAGDLKLKDLYSSFRALKDKAKENYGKASLSRLVQAIDASYARAVDRKQALLDFAGKAPYEVEDKVKFADAEISSHINAYIAHRKNTLQEEVAKNIGILYKEGAAKGPEPESN